MRREFSLTPFPYVDDNGLKAHHLPSFASVDLARTTVASQLDLQTTRFHREPRNLRGYTEMKKDVTDITDNIELENEAAVLVGDLYHRHSIRVDIYSLTRKGRYSSRPEQTG
ncbi:hypothetical protein HYALB_00002217 [Hymenoscyphus albidus]|uniref:Uncharacterized protein n=1 Tax=Hymenoscyphus albidus TaxID=595503 RepID=A0A9N9Q4U9_9HELO|nr:hypothetical protein HYALB_00002217 [Hymenoscyphus albidus]